MKIKYKDANTKSKEIKQIIKLGLHHQMLKKCKRLKKTRNSLLQGSKRRNQILESIAVQRDSAVTQGNNVTNNVSRPRSENVSANISVVQMSSNCKNNFISLNSLLHNVQEDEEIMPNIIPLTSLLPTACKTSSSSTNISGQNNIKSINVNQAKHVNDEFNVIECDVQKNFAEKTCKTVKKCSITVRTSEQQITSAVIYELNRSKCLVVLKPENYFYFVGIVELELVQGSVEILGYNLHESKTKLLVFSPLGSSHVYIKATMNELTLNSARYKQLELLGLPQKTQRDILKGGENCSIFILSRKKAHVSNSVWPLLFENHLSFSIFSPSSLKELKTENRPCHVIECKFGETQEKIPEHGKEIVELLEWQNVVEGISHQDSPKVVICGGKSVGKSTFLRYVTNKCLKNWNKVLVLDFDPGQCEFTVAGCISVSLVEEPVLGPNFTHLREPVRSIFLGEVDVKKCPGDYIEGCKTLIKYAVSNFNSTPWLINTMGFSRGFGVTLICGIIQNVGPTNVIQIVSKHSKFNFPSQLEPGFVYNQDVGSFGTFKGLKMYKFHLLPCAPEQQSSTSHRQRDINPQEARRLVTLSYLSYMMESKTSLTQVTPYVINMDLLNLRTTNKSNLSKTEIAAAMNGNLVALCSQSENDVFPNCHGFGIVRGIDVEAGLLFLITPVPNQTLRKVNCLIKGSVALPDSLYYNQGVEVKGHIPYMAHTSGGSTALFAKRDYRTLPVTKPSRNATLIQVTDREHK